MKSDQEKASELIDHSDYLLNQMDKLQDHAYNLTKTCERNATLVRDLLAVIESKTDKLKAERAWSKELEEALEGIKSHFENMIGLGVAVNPKIKRILDETLAKKKEILGE